MAIVYWNWIDWVIDIGVAHEPFPTWHFCNECHWIVPGTCEP